MRRWTGFCAVLLIVASTAAQAQNLEDVIETLRSDIRTEKQSILTEALGLSEAQSQVFWPMYREYETKLAALWDQRLNLIKDYSANMETMTEEKAGQLGKQALEIEKQQLDLKKSAYNNFSKKLSPSIAGRWLQTESAMQRVIELQAGAALPLIEVHPPAAPPASADRK
jgi:DNA anti-recombination protein RmuC